jgi:hypothetical protein
METSKVSLPAARVLGLELLRQLRCSGHTEAKSVPFKRSTVIQTLSNLVGEASWLEHLRLIRMREKGHDERVLPLRGTAVATVEQATSKRKLQDDDDSNDERCRGAYRGTRSRRMRVQFGEAMSDIDS